jgi:MFS family permease
MRGVTPDATLARMGQQGDRLFTPAFIALTLAELAYFAASGLVIAVTPFYVGGHLGVDEAGVGVVAGAFAVTTLLLRPYAGRLSDRRGRRPLLIGGALLFAVVMAAHIAATGVLVLVGLRLLLGVAEAFFFVAGYAALADLAPPSRRGEALSYNSVALYLGIALGPPVGQALVEWSGYGAAWLGASALAATATLLAALVPETLAPSESERPPTPLIHRAAIIPGLALFSGVTAMSGFFLLGGRHADALGLGVWSLAFLVFGGVVVLSRIALARLPDRVPPLSLAAIALALAGLGSVAVGMATTSEALLVGAGILALGVSLMTPALFAATFARVPADERGSASGTATMFIDLGFGGGPFVIGFAAAGLGIAGALLASAAIAFAGSLGIGAAAVTAPGSGGRRRVWKRSWTSWWTTS